MGFYIYTVQTSILQKWARILMRIHSYKISSTPGFFSKNSINFFLKKTNLKTQTPSISCGT